VVPHDRVPAPVALLGQTEVVEAHAPGELHVLRLAVQPRERHADLGADLERLSEHLGGQREQPAVRQREPAGRGGHRPLHRRRRVGQHGQREHGLLDGGVGVAEPVRRAAGHRVEAGLHGQRGLVEPALDALQPVPGLGRPLQVEQRRGPYHRELDLEVGRHAAVGDRVRAQPGQRLVESVESRLAGQPTGLGEPLGEPILGHVREFRVIQ
jgi:hypothetical protein